MGYRNQVDPRKLSNDWNNPSSCDLSSNIDNKEKKKGLSDKCAKALDDLDTLLNASESKNNPRKLHTRRSVRNLDGTPDFLTEVKSGVRLRYYHLRKDRKNLYVTKRTGNDSYEGHRNFLHKELQALRQVMKVVDGSSCKDEIKEWLKTLSPEMRAKYEKLIKKGKEWINADVPKQPDQSLSDRQERGQEPNPKPGPAPVADPNLQTPSLPSIDVPNLWWILPAAGEILRQLIPTGQGASLPNQMQESNISNQTKASNPKTEKTDKEVADIYLEGAKKARSENPNATLTESRSYAYKHVSKILGSDYVRSHPDQLKKVDGAYVSARSEILASQKASPTKQLTRDRELRL